MRKALLIGINNYKDAKLTCCVNDVNALKQLLEHNYDVSTNFNVVTLQDDDADVVSVKEKTKALFANDADVALFYFSGHGYDDGDDGTIVCSDANTDNILFKMSDIVKLATNSKCKNKIIILDCCYAGYCGTDALIGDKTFLGNGMVILTSSRENEASIEENGHGLFTNLLIGALQGGAADLLGNITPASIYSYIDHALNAWEQRPYFRANVSSFVSLRKDRPKIEIKELKDGLVLFKNSNYEYMLDPSYEYTNTPQSGHNYKEPYADEKNVKLFKLLQKMQKNGLVVPCAEEYMYYAAMNSKSCSLTELGKHYWYLMKNNKI